MKITSRLLNLWSWFVCRLSLHDCVMIVLTLVIAGSAVHQTKLIRDQAALLREQQDRLTRPVAKVVATSTVMVRPKSSKSSELETTQLVGFRVTNHSPFPIIIENVLFEMWNEDEGVRQVGLGDPVRTFDGKLLSHDFPRRLQYGESMQVLYRKDNGAFKASNRIRATFRDSLQNAYPAPYWVKWTDTETVAYIMDNL